MSGQVDQSPTSIPFISSRCPRCNLHLQEVLTKVIQTGKIAVVEAKVILDFVRRFADSNPPPRQRLLVRHREVVMQRTSRAWSISCRRTFPKIAPSQTSRRTALSIVSRNLPAWNASISTSPIDGPASLPRMANRGKDTTTRRSTSARSSSSEGQTLASLPTEARYILFIDEFSDELIQRSAPAWNCGSAPRYTNPALREVRLGVRPCHQQGDIEERPPSRSRGPRSSRKRPRPYKLDEKPGDRGQLPEPTTYCISPVARPIINIGKTGRRHRRLRRAWLAKREDWKLLEVPCM